MKENLSGDCHPRHDEAVHHRLRNSDDEMEMFSNEEVLRRKMEGDKDNQQKF